MHHTFVPHAQMHHDHMYHGYMHQGQGLFMDTCIMDFILLQQEIQVESLTMELREVFWRTAKIFFQLALLITFLFYFGMPAIEK